MAVETRTAAESLARREREVELSVIVPITERWNDLAELHARYSEEFAGHGRPFEFLFVLDGPREDALHQLRALKREHPEVRVVMLNRPFGEATALSVGFAQARGATLITLASYEQVEPPEVHLLLERLRQERTDLVVSWRHPRIDSTFNHWQSAVFHWLVCRLTGTQYHDVSCGLRAMKRRVADEIQLYGDLHRFLPILAFERGFKVAEVPVRQSAQDARRRIYGPGVYLRRVLDVLTLFFLFKFTKKPLRFFGLLSVGLCASGAAITTYLGLYRLLGFGGIAGRPLLILGVLLLVLGVQLFSIGLLGEILIFTHAQARKDFTVEEFLD